ncbi:MAG: hypothetical protein SFW35_09640 [Chitinophagales bacterium]|nr:hypothetical protein [Chitinophagales bacterium]
MKSEESALKLHLIDKYREFIASRYDYIELKESPGFPAQITEEMVDSLREYFLQYLYPEAVFREQLDAAFDQLEHYVNHPSKVWGLMGNITAAIFRFGAQFPAALKAGLVSLEAHTAAKRFEKTLVKAALDKGYAIPVSDEQFIDCIKAIPLHQLERFITELGQLFNSFTNSRLLEKTILIMKDVLATMKAKPHLYGPTEVDAITMGIEILRHGYQLFSHYDNSLKRQMVNFIVANERQFIHSIHGIEKP